MTAFAARAVISTYRRPPAAALLPPSPGESWSDNSFWDDDTGWVDEEGLLPVTNYGPWLRDDSSGSARETNRATMANAIATVGAAGGGVITIPAGHYYLQQANLAAEQAAIHITHDNITLRGAGIGATVLHTRNDYNAVAEVRGHGIQVSTTGGAARANITLEHFELTADLGHTGNYQWDPWTPDGWDVTNKGIIFGWDTGSTNITVRDVYVHGYRGELIYSGGWDNNSLTLQRVYSHDSNGSCYNFLADSVLVEDCTFGDARFWVEIANTNVIGQTIIRRCVFHNSIRANDAGMAFSDMSGNNSYLIQDCRFIDADLHVGLFGSIDNTIDLEFDSCFFTLGTSVFNQGQVYPAPSNGLNAHGCKIANVQHVFWGFGGSVQNSLVDGNDFDGTGGGAFFFADGGDFSGTVISNNTYRDTAALSSGTQTVAPTFTSNSAGGALSDTTAPSTPTGLEGWAAQPAPGTSLHRTFVRWAESTDNVGVRQYRVRRNGSPVALTPYPWFMDTGLAASTLYTYTVAALDVAGNESSQSAGLQVTTGA